MPRAGDPCRGSAWDAENQSSAVEATERIDFWALLASRSSTLITRQLLGRASQPVSTDAECTRCIPGIQLMETRCCSLRHVQRFAPSYCASSEKTGKTSPKSTRRSDQRDANLTEESAWFAGLDSAQTLDTVPQFEAQVHPTWCRNNSVISFVSGSRRGPVAAPGPRAARG